MPPRRSLPACLLALLLLAAPLQAQDAEVPRTFPSTEDPAFPHAPPEAVGLDGPGLQALADSVASWVAAGALVGAEILIVKDGRTVLHETIGWGHRERGLPLQPNSIYRIRSMTKPVVGTAVLMLVDEGRLSLDDTVAAYLPSFDNDRSRSITVRDLLTHTSGLRNHDDFDIGLPREPDEYDSLRALVDDIGEIGPLEPRGVLHYSSSGTATLAALVAEISGMPVEQFIESRILEPLEMNHTYTRFAPDVPWADRMNSTYRWRGGEAGFERYWDPSMEQRHRYFRGHGGLYSTVNDYAKFVAMWMNKGRSGDVRLLSEATAESALRALAGGQYGFHWQVPQTPIVGGMPAMFAHEGADGTIALAFPHLDAMVLYFTQSRGPGVREALRFELSRLPDFARHVTSVRSGVLLGREEALPEPLSAEERRRYLGSYVGSIIIRGEERLRNQWTYEVRIENDMLVGNLSRRGFRVVATMPPWHHLIPQGDGVFIPGRVVDGRLVETVPDVQVRFDLPEAGASRHLEIRPDDETLLWSLIRQ